MYKKRTADQWPEAASEVEAPSVPQKWIRTHLQVKRARYSQLCMNHLPGEILDYIVGYLEQRDLVRLCLVSKTLQTAASKRLYQKISLHNDCYSEPPGLPIQNSDYHSVGFSSKANNLLATVENNKTIASLIKSFTITEDPDDSYIPDVSAYLTRFLTKVRLESFNFMEKIPIAPHLISSVRRMTRPAYLNSTFPSNLVELKIDYADWSPRLVQALAREMLEQNSYHKLKKLAFQTLIFPYYLMRVSRDQILSADMPFWCYFFLPFVNKGIQLNLTALSIEGEFWDDAYYETAMLMSQAVNLSNLHTLEIKIKRYFTHPQLIPQEDGMHTFLDDITKKTHSLENLSIVHPFDCCQDDLEVFDRILRKNIPNQLKQLHLKFSDQRNSELEFIQRSILKHQRNLVKLTISMQIFGCDNETQKFVGVPELAELKQEIQGDLFLRETYSPTIIDYDQAKPVIGERFSTVIISHREKILEYLESDPIFKCAAEDLPFLREYFVMGLYVNVKERSVMFNGRSIKLDWK